MTNILPYFKDVLRLTKSEIVLLEAITVAAGYFIGQSLEVPIDWNRFLYCIFGVSFLALASGALNQIQEKQEDAQMNRTKTRPLPSGRISVSFAWTLVIGLLIFGSILLAKISTPVLILGWIAVISYNGLYTLWWKRKMAFAAIPGAIPGALPILIGFQAAANPDYFYSFSSELVSSLRGIYLFAVLFFWQMPHFWVLALKYSDDYDQGGFPTLPVAKGNHVTRFQITLWCLAYAALGLLSVLFFPLGNIGLLGALAVSGWLMFELFRFLRKPAHETWLRFFLSINLSMLMYLGFIFLDLWSIYFHPRG